MTSPLSFEFDNVPSFELCNVPVLFKPLGGSSTILPGLLVPAAFVPDDGSVTILPPSPILSTPILPTLLPPDALVPDGSVTTFPPSPSLAPPTHPYHPPPAPPARRADPP